MTLILREAVIERIEVAYDEKTREQHSRYRTRDGGRNNFWANVLNGVLAPILVIYLLFIGNSRWYHAFLLADWASLKTWLKP